MSIVVFSKNNIGIQIYVIILLSATGCGLDGRAPRLGRGGPQFESGHPDPSTHCRSLRVYDLMSRRALSLSKSKKETSLKVSDRESKAKGPEFIDGQSS